MKEASTKKRVGERGKEKIKNPDNLSILRERLFKKTKRFTGAELEKRTHVSDSSINSIVNGDRSNVKIDNLISIAKGLGTSIDYLVGLSDFDSADVSVKDISKKTHLSKESIYTLMYDPFLLDHIDTVNELISSYGFSHFIEMFFDYLNYSEYLIDSVSDDKYHLTPKGIELALLDQCADGLKTIRLTSQTQTSLNIQAYKDIEERLKSFAADDISPEKMNLQIDRDKLRTILQHSDRVNTYRKEIIMEAQNGKE